jgi:hypothetical protein
MHDKTVFVTRRFKNLHWTVHSIFHYFSLIPVHQKHPSATSRPASKNPETRNYLRMKNSIESIYPFNRVFS